MKIIGLFLIALLTASLNVHAQPNLDKAGLAMQGYDPVSYHQKDGPQKGNADQQHTHDGQTYHFASAANLKTFQANPTKYLPAYGGWCAYALHKGTDLVEINPKAYLIIDGKNYLFYKTVLADTRKRWQKESQKDTEKQLIQNADQNWKKAKS